MMANTSRISKSITSTSVQRGLGFPFSFILVPVQDKLVGHIAERSQDVDDEDYLLGAIHYQVPLEAEGEGFVLDLLDLLNVFNGTLTSGLASDPC